MINFSLLVQIWFQYFQTYLIVKYIFLAKVIIQPFNDSFCLFIESQMILSQSCCIFKP